MKKNFRKTSLLLLISLMALANQAQAQVEQTCNENIVKTAPTSRFTDNNDGTVTDSQTALVWAQCPQGLFSENCTGGTIGTFSWGDALALNGVRPTSVTTGATSGTDWRLPNVKELSSLTERACINPSINLTRFPNGDANDRDFWSASPVAHLPMSSWIVTFNKSVDGVDFRLRDVRNAVRLVRGGQ